MKFIYPQKCVCFVLEILHLKHLMRVVVWVFTILSQIVSPMMVCAVKNAIRQDLWDTVKYQAWGT